MTIERWDSDWEHPAAFSFHAQQDSIKQIDSDIVAAIKKPLLTKSAGKWGQYGIRYIYDRNNKPYAVVFSSNSEGDIFDVDKFKKWSHSANAKQATSGMPIFVVPNEKIIAANPTAIGVKFRLDKITHE